MDINDIKKKREALEGIDLWRGFSEGLDKLFNRLEQPESPEEQADYIEREERSAKLNAGDRLYKGRDK